MDVSETPDGVPGPDEDPPDFGDWETPETVFEGGPVRERLLDVVMQLREPTRVAVVAEDADCDTETAREYLEWFASMGIVREHAGRPVRYERNESYLFWRRVERIRREYSEERIVEELAETVASIEAFEQRFDADSPDAISLVDASDSRSVEAMWQALSEWKTLRQRAALLDAARQKAARGSHDSIDA